MIHIRIETVASEVKESVIKEAMAMAHQATKIIIDAQLVEAYRRKYPPVPLTSSASISTLTLTSTSTSTSTSTPTPTPTSTSIPSKVKKVKKSKKVVGEEKEGSVIGSASDKEVESMIIAKQAKSKTNNNNDDEKSNNNFFTKLNKKIDQNATIMNGGEKIVGEEIIHENETSSTNQKNKKNNKNHENKIENNNENENENKVKTLFKEGAEKRKNSDKLSTLDVTKLLNLFNIGNAGLESALLKRMKLLKDEHTVTNDDGKSLAWSVSEQDNILIEALKPKNIPQVPQVQTRKNPTVGNLSVNAVLKSVNAVLNDELTELGSEDKGSAEAMLEALYVKKVETKSSDGESVFKRPTATVDTVEDSSEKVVSSAGKGKKGKNKAVIAPTATSGEIEGGGGGLKGEEAAAVTGGVKKSKKKKAAPTSASNSTSPVAEVEVVDEVNGVESKLAAMMAGSNSRSHIASIDTTPTPAVTFTQAAAGSSSLSQLVAAMESEAVSSNSNSNSNISSRSVSDGVLESLPLPTTPHLVPSPAHTTASLSTPTPTPTPTFVSASKVALEQLQHQVEVAVDPSVKYSLPIKTGFAMPEGLKDFAFTAGYGEAVKLFRLSCGMSAEGGAIPEGTGSTASMSKQVRSRGEGSLRASISQKITEHAEWGTAHPVIFTHLILFL